MITRFNARWAAAASAGLVLVTCLCIQLSAAIAEGLFDNLPLGIAVTLEFLGPFAVAFLGTRIRWKSVFPVIALGGVALISDPTGGMTLKGLLFGLGAAAAFGGYTLLAGVVGRTSSGFSGLAPSSPASCWSSCPAQPSPGSPAANDLPP